MTDVLRQATESQAVRMRAGRQRRFARGPAATVMWYVAALVLVVAVWQIIVWLTDTPDYLLPTPAQTAEALVTYHPVLLDHAGVTIREIAIGFGISAVLGVLIAIPIAFSATIERLAYPLLVMGQAVPKIALGPLFLVWLGFGAVTNTIIVISVAVFPIIINAALGLTEIDPDLVRLGRSMGASRLRLFWRIRLPNSLPNIFAGFKVGITLAVIGAVVGEFIASSSGLGYLTLSASGKQNVLLVFAAIIALAFIGIVAFGLVELAERLFIRRYSKARDR